MATMTSRLDSNELLHLAIAASRKDDHEKAIGHLKQALELAPDNARVHYFLGAEHAQIGLYERAMEGIEASDVAIEVSTAGLRKPVGEIYPAREFLELCLEVGRPDGSGELKGALALADGLLAAEAAGVEFVLYDIAGEPAEIAVPLLESAGIERIVAVSTADAGALHAVNDLLSLLGGAAASQPLAGGIIGNLLPGPYAEAIIDDFARQTAIAVTGYIPRSLVVTRSNFFGETVIDAAPLAHQAYIYRKLARDLAAGRPAPVVPLPLDNAGFRDWSLDWGERLFDLGEGLVEGGAAI